MKDPVVTADAHTYERKANTAWLAKNNTSPMTGATLETTSLYPNVAMRGRVCDFIKTHPEHAGRV